VDTTVRTTYLGQYTDELANAIAGELEAAQIAWTYKQATFITRALFMGEWGTRLFVDKTKLAEARAIAERVAAEGVPTDEET
jgi:hypothetical protein